MENSTTEMQMPSFVHLTIISTTKQDVDGEMKSVVTKLPCRINPYFISSYYGGAYYLEDGTLTQGTNVYVSGTYYLVDMPIEKFDEMIADIDSSLKIKES